MSNNRYVSPCRVNVLYALAEAVPNNLIMQDIESAGGKLSVEHTEQLEELILQDVMKLRSVGKWPLPKIVKPLNKD